MVLVGEQQFVNGNLWSPLAVLIKSLHICLCFCNVGIYILHTRVSLYVVICWHVRLYPVLLQYCTHVTVCVYLCRWTSWKAWWAAVCQSCLPVRHSGLCPAPCSRSLPSLTATACGSHSTEGWHPEPCQAERGEWECGIITEYTGKVSTLTSVIALFQINCAGE